MPLSEALTELAAAVSNWGRWGDDDELGTQNLVDAQAVERGVRSATRGTVVSLAIPLDESGPQEPGGARGRINPKHSMFSINQGYTGDPRDAAFNDDEVRLSLAAGTHVDAIAHVTYDGLMYNGYPASLVTAAGASKCGVDKLIPMVTRGVLLDLPTVLGVERLAEGYAITADDLDAAVDHARITVEPGDAMLVRTGHMQLLSQGLTEKYNRDSAGPSTQTIRWFRDRDVAAVFTDTYVFEVWPPEDWECMMPVHMIHLRDMGLIQGQNWNFEQLADVCAAEGAHEFQLVSAPEPFTGALSAPAHPVAIL